VVVVEGSTEAVEVSAGGFMAGWEDFTAALVAGMVPRAVVAGMGPPVAGMVARVGAGVIPALVGDIPAGVVDGVGEADGGSVSVSTLVGVGPPIRMHTAIRTTTLTIHTGPYNYPPPPPPAGPGQGNQGPPRDNAWQQQNSDAPAPPLSPDHSVTTIKAPKAPPRYTNYRTVAAVNSTSRPEVRNVIRALQAMPPEARQRQIESGRYRNLAPEEQELIKRVALTSSVVGTR